MRAWHFSENAYPFLPPAETYESIRVNLPNRNYDPHKGAALYDRFIEEWQIAEEEGVEIMLNEHHQTATCVDPAAPLVLAALARVTSKARLLILGNPIASRFASPRRWRSSMCCRMGGSKRASCAACPTRCCRRTATRCG
jgi:hypothetical protein